MVVSVGPDGLLFGLGLLVLVALFVVVASLRRRTHGFPVFRIAPMTTGAVELLFHDISPSGLFGSESATDIADFRHYGETAVDFKEIFAAIGSRLTVYCYDQFSDRIVLVEVDPEALRSSDSNHGSFFYQVQRALASRAFAVPFPIFKETLSTFIPTDEEKNRLLSSTIFLHNAGGCGSNLLCRLLNAVGDVQSFADMDLFTNVVILQKFFPENVSTQQKHELLRWSTLQLVYSLTMANPSKPRVLIKIRSFVISIAEMIRLAVPEAKNIFMYRSPHPTIDAFCLLIFNSGLAKLMRRLHLDSLYIHRLSNLPLLFSTACPLMNDLRFPKAVVRSLGIVGLTLMSWLSVMDAALELQKKDFFDACFRFDELVQSPRPVLEYLFVTCGFLDRFVSDDVVAEVLSSDPDARLSLVRRRGQDDYLQYIRSSDLASINSLLGCHTELQELKFMLPSTFRLPSS